MHSKYIHYVLRRQLSHDPTFGVCRDNTDCSFRIGRWSFKYKDKNVFVDGRKYKATRSLWKFLTKSRPLENVVTFQDKHAFKQILLQSNAHKE